MTARQYLWSYGWTKPMPMRMPMRMKQRWWDTFSHIFAKTRSHMMSYIVRVDTRNSNASIACTSNGSTLIFVITVHMLKTMARLLTVQELTQEYCNDWSSNASNHTYIVAQTLQPQELWCLTLSAHDTFIVTISRPRTAPDDDVSSSLMQSGHVKYFLLPPLCHPRAFHFLSMFSFISKLAWRKNIQWPHCL